jgi:peroxiredoxin family protein
VTVAAILATGEPERLYSGLSVLVSTAVDGEPCAALATFGSLRLLLARENGSGEQFDRSLRELIETALELGNLTVHACAASVETLALDPAELERRGLDGVKSTPRFLRDNAEASLLFV